ncbi:DUF1145 family protein [Enterobacteriaceae bacterium ESL0689]|nr:DUF1145 family protein [Enterobacteriaceae bacterium ESL0689]
MLINIGRLLILCVWAFLLSNLFQPFPKPLNIFTHVALLLTVVMHGLQLMLLKVVVIQKTGSIPLSRWQQVRIFIFGVLELLVWQKNHLRGQSKQP